MPQSIIGQINQWDQSNENIFPPSTLYNVIIGEKLNPSGFKFLVVGNSKMEGNLEITGTLNTTIENIKVEDKSDNVNYQMIFINSSGNQIPVYTNNQITYNPSTDTFIVGNLSSDLTTSSGYLSSNLIGLIQNNQLQNDSITIGTTEIDLGASATTITGIINLTATNITGDLTASTGYLSSNLIGFIQNTQLQNDSITIGTTEINLGSSATIISGLTEINCDNYIGGREITSLDLQPNIDYYVCCVDGIGTEKILSSRTGFTYNPSTDLLTVSNIAADGSNLTNIPNIDITDDPLNNSWFRIIFSDSAGSNKTLNIDSGLDGIRYNPFADTLSVRFINSYCNGLNLSSFTSTKSFVFVDGTGGHSVSGATINDISFDNTNKRLGIGKSNPAYSIDCVGTINADNNDSSSYIANSSSYSSYPISIGGWFASAGTDHRIQGSNNLHIDSSTAGDMYLNYYSNKNIIIGGGNLGIGTASPGYEIDCVGTINADNNDSSSYIANSSTYSSYSISVGGWFGSAGTDHRIQGSSNLHIDSASAGDIYLNYYSNTDIIIGNTGGNLGIGTQSPSYPIHITRVPSSNNPSSTAHNFLRFGTGFSAGAGGLAANQFPVQIYCDGGSILTNQGLYSISDIRIKTDITPLKNMLNKVSLLNPVTYEYIDKAHNGVGEKWGFIAQDIKEVFPQFVKDNLENYVPSVFKLCKKINNNFVFTEPHNITQNTMLRFDKENNNFCMIKCGVIDEYNIKILECCEADCEIEENEEVVCYGEKINDFHSFDEMSLISVSIKAVQELTIENNILKKEMLELKNELQLIKQHLNL